MTDNVTTKPGKKYASIKRPQIYEALRRRGYSKESAARISNAQARKRTKAYTLDDLERVALKAVPIDAVTRTVARRTPPASLAGRQISPGITRIRGNLCNVHGRYGPCNGTVGSGKRKPLKGGAARKPRKPIKTPEQRTQERQAEHAANRARVLEGMGIDAGSRSALDALRQGKQPSEQDIKRAGLEEAGLVERGEDGNYRMTGSGRSVLSAADQGDAGRAGDIISAARDRTSARHGRQSAAADRKRVTQERRAAADRKRGAPRQRKRSTRPSAGRHAGTGAGSSGAGSSSSGGGGSGGGAKPGKQPETQTISPALVSAAQKLSDGDDISDADASALVRNGLARVNKDGILVLTARGLTAISRKSFAVFKDARGQWRWIAKTTTAFEDRDNEIISMKALEADVTRADADGQYGPLRWWHIGKPDPLDADAPWGPGVDLGWADFNAMSGKTLIESGTFTSEAIARAVAAKADDLELSPGFFHAANEPDQTGVFTHIRRFERSLVPKWAGRASNRYTGLIVQGKEAMDDKKIQALKDLGIPETTIDALVADVKQTEKAAEADGVRYKEANPVVDFFRSFFASEQVATKTDPVPAAETEVAPAPEAEADPIQLRIKAMEDEIAALKAPPVAEANDEVVVEEDAAGDFPPDAPPDEMPVDDGSGDVGGLTLSAEDLSAMGEIFKALLEPLIGALGITNKLEGHLGELKTMMGGYTKTKDDAQAAQAEEVAALKASIDQQQAKLAELIGDEPRAGYRASAAKDNVLNPDVLAAIKENAPSGADFSDITQQLFPQLNGNRQ